jgi:hypothetical protein
MARGRPRAEAGEPSGLASVRASRTCTYRTRMTPDAIFAPPRLIQTR